MRAAAASSCVAVGAGALRTLAPAEASCVEDGGGALRIAFAPEERLGVLGALTGAGAEGVG